MVGGLFCFSSPGALISGMSTNTEYYKLSIYMLLLIQHSRIKVIYSRKLHPYYRSERGIASKHTAHHRAISSAQVAVSIIKSLDAPNHGPLLSAPFTFFCCSQYEIVAGTAGRPGTVSGYPRASGIVQFREFESPRVHTRINL